MSKWFWFWLVTWSLLAVINVAWIVSENQRIEMTHRYEVQQTCDKAMRTHKFENCYRLEGRYGMEFVCSTGAIDADCWVEVK